MQKNFIIYYLYISYQVSQMIGLDFDWIWIFGKEFQLVIVKSCITTMCFWPSILIRIIMIVMNDHVMSGRSHNVLLLSLPIDFRCKPVFHGCAVPIQYLLCISWTYFSNPTRSYHFLYLQIVDTPFLSVSHDHRTFPNMLPVLNLNWVWITINWPINVLKLCDCSHRCIVCLFIRKYMPMIVV